MTHKLFAVFFFAIYTLANTNQIESLQNDIKENFIPKMQSVRGVCDQKDTNGCVNQYTDLEFGDYYTLSAEDNKEICLPYTECGFYHCMENKYHCEDEGVNYFTKFAAPACGKYIKNINRNKFSKKGTQWIYSVMVCLQKSLIEECELKGNCNKETAKKTCSYINKFTIEFHSKCYLESGVGICKLPIKDKISIWNTVKEFLSTKERVQAYKVIFSCINPFKKK